MNCPPLVANCRVPLILLSLGSGGTDFCNAMLLERTFLELGSGRARNRGHRVKRRSQWPNISK